MVKNGELKNAKRYFLTSSMIVDGEEKISSLNFITIIMIGLSTISMFWVLV